MFYYLKEWTDADKDNRYIFNWQNGMTTISPYKFSEELMAWGWDWNKKY